MVSLTHDVPKPDALLMAKLLTEWPHPTNIDFVWFVCAATEEQRRNLRRIARDLDAYRDVVGSHPYQIRSHTRRLDLSDTDAVVLRMVFVRDPICSAHTGRNITYDEWVEAREYLKQREEV